MTTGLEGSFEAFSTNETTIMVLTDSLGKYSANYLDPRPYDHEESGREAENWNSYYANKIWFKKDGYLDWIIDDLYGKRKFDSTYLMKQAFLKLVINPISVADGIAVYRGNSRWLPSNEHIYTSNLYAKVESNSSSCRVDKPRYAEFIFSTEADMDFFVCGNIYPGGSCSSAVFEKFTHTNPDNKDTLVFQIDY